MKNVRTIHRQKMPKRKGVNYGIHLFVHYVHCYFISFFYLAFYSKRSTLAT